MGGKEELARNAEKSMIFRVLPGASALTINMLDTKYEETSADTVVALIKLSSNVIINFWV